MGEAPEASMESLEESSGYKDEPRQGPDAQDDAGPPAAGAFSWMATTRTALRALEFVFSLISFSLAASSQSSSNYTALSVKPVAFLLAMGVIVAVYALAAAVLLVLAITRPDSNLSYKLPRPLLVADFVALLLLFAASSSAAGFVTLLECTGSNVCSLITGAVVLGYFASICLMADFWLTLAPVFLET